MRPDRPVFSLTDEAHNDENMIDVAYRVAAASWLQHHIAGHRRVHRRERDKYVLTQLCAAAR